MNQQLGQAALGGKVSGSQVPGRGGPNVGKSSPNHVPSRSLGGVGRALATCPALLGRQKEHGHHGWEAE